MMLRKWMVEALACSLRAGDAIMEVYSSDFEVCLKDDQSPLTEADRRSHKILTAGLCPDIPLISEEGLGIPYEDRKSWSRYWLVDPLDGTKEFIKRNGEFTVNVALVEEARPVFGAVYLPAKRELFWACRGQGAFRLQADGLDALRNAAGGAAEAIFSLAITLATPLPDPGAADESGSLKIVHSADHVAQEEVDFIARLNAETGRVETSSAGSSLKFCRVAEGFADLYPRFGPTMEWDTAAGQCVAETAGCEVVDLAEMARLGYNKPSLRNNSFMVLGPRLRTREEWKSVALKCAGMSLAAARTDSFHG